MSEPPQLPTPRKLKRYRLANLLNIPLMATILICFFLPLVNLHCGSVEAHFTGINLATGSQPQIVGLPENSPPSQAYNQNYPTDPALLAVPILALIGLIAFLATLRSPRKSSRALALAPLAILIILGIYCAIDFGIERDVAKKKIDDPQSVQGITVEKPRGSISL